VVGLQGSFLFAKADDVRGLQGSFGVTLGRDAEGIQSGTVSVARDVKGLQFGLVSVARDVRGGQLELVGVARDMDGGQLGLVNVAKSADVQFGLVNVAERVDGAAIGLVSIAGNGYVEPVCYGIAGSRASSAAGMKFVAGLAYTQLAAGMTRPENDVRYFAEFGGGLHVEPPLLRDGRVVDRSAVEVGMHVQHNFLTESEKARLDEEALHYRAGFGVRFFRAFWLFAGYDVSHELDTFGTNVVQGPWAGFAVF
jgi:hypothetical protein